MLLGLQVKELPMGRVRKKTGKGEGDSEENIVPDAWEEKVLRISDQQGQTLLDIHVTLRFKDFISDPTRAVPVAW